MESCFDNLNIAVILGLHSRELSLKGFSAVD